MQIASDGLKGRVFECSLADLNQVRRAQPRCAGGIQSSMLAHTRGVRVSRLARRIAPQQRADRQCLHALTRPPRDQPLSNSSADGRWLGDERAGVQDEDQSFRKMKLRCEDVQGRNVLTNFWVRVQPSPPTLSLATVAPWARSIPCHSATRSHALQRSMHCSSASTCQRRATVKRGGGEDPTASHAVRSAV